MRKLLLVVLLCGLNAGVAVAEANVPASRACGTITGPAGKRLLVTVKQGDDISCDTARKAAHRFLPRSGKGSKSFELDQRQWSCSDVHGRSLTSGAIARCTSDRVAVIVGQVAPRAGRDRKHPLPFGATGTRDGWKIKVLSVTPDATDDVLDENMFNDPPADGWQFYIATVQATFTGSGSQSLDAGYRLRAVGRAAVEYTTFDDSCGVIPDEITDTHVFRGGTVRGNVCWQVWSGDAASLVMYDVGEGLFEDRLFYALAP